MEQQKNNKEELIKEVLEEENKIKQYIDNLEKEISEIKKRIIIKQAYLDELNKIDNQFN